MQQLLTILGVSGIYALLATGLVLVYRTSRVINLAQGHLAVFGGFFAAALLGGNQPWIVAIPLTLIGGAGLAAIIYFAVMRRIVGEPPFVGLMATVGIAILLRGLMVLLFGGAPVTTHPFLAGSIHLFGADVPATHVMVAAIAWAIVGAIVAFNSFSSIGLFMRATTDDVILAAQRGINIDRIALAAWIIAVAAAAAAGVLHGQRALVSTAAILIGVNALIAALIGGMDSFAGAAVGALIVAVTEHVVLLHFEARYADLAPVVLMLIILTVRPWGLFGTPEEVERV
jgi:branched-chain amino acid transport system permease protein